MRTRNSSKLSKDNKDKARARDYNEFFKDNEKVSGKEIHHLFYSKEYNPDSFIYIDPYEHDKIHSEIDNESYYEDNEYSYTVKSDVDYYYNNIEC